MITGLSVGDRVRVSIACFGENDDCSEVWVAAGSVATVYLVDNYRPPQGLAIGVVFENGVTAVFDEEDGSYPLEAAL